MASNHLFRAILGLGFAVIVVTIVGSDVVGLAFGGLAFVLVMTTTKWGAVFLGVTLAGIFFFSEFLSNLMTQYISDPRVVLTSFAVMGIIFGKIEEFLFGFVFGED